MPPHFSSIWAAFVWLNNRLGKGLEDLWTLESITSEEKIEASASWNLSPKLMFTQWILYTLVLACMSPSKYSRMAESILRSKQAIKKWGYLLALGIALVLQIDDDVERLDLSFVHQPLQNVGVDSGKTLFHQNLPQAFSGSLSLFGKRAELALVMVVLYEILQVGLEARQVYVEIRPEAVVSPEHVN